MSDDGAAQGPILSRPTPLSSYCLLFLLILSQIRGELKEAKGRALTPGEGTEPRGRSKNFHRGPWMASVQVVPRNRQSQRQPVPLVRRPWP